MVRCYMQVELGGKQLPSGGRPSPGASWGPQPLVAYPERAEWQWCQPVAAGPQITELYLMQGHNQRVWEPWGY